VLSSAIHKLLHPFLAIFNLNVRFHKKLIQAQLAPRTVAFKRKLLLVKNELSINK
jgi:hypothetical protein